MSGHYKIYVNYALVRDIRKPRSCFSDDLAELRSKSAKAWAISREGNPIKVCQNFLHFVI